MKFLYFGDLHETPKPPISRKDDFRATVYAKIQEIRELGMKYKVKAFLQPGDFLDKPKFDTAFLSEVVNRWGFSDIQLNMLELATGEVNLQDISKQLQNHIPIVGAIGNHELYGESLKSYPKTSLAFLEKIGFMHLPSKDKPFIFKDESGFTVAITATHYDIGMDDPSRMGDYIVEQKMGDYHIHIVHGYLTNKDMGNLFPHTTVDDIAKKTKADLTITGHDHIGFKLLEIDGKQFVNPGAIVRLTNDVKEIRRKPKVLLIDVDKDNGITVKTIYLKSAQKGEDVLDRSHKVFQQNMTAKLEQIKSLVNKSNVGSGLSITEIIQRISESQQIDDDLKDRAIKAVTDKMNAIQKQGVTATDYFIEKIVLENFQSHKYSEYELKKGLNVFIGKSSSGKSAIQRALAWVYENEGRDPRRFIKNGEDFTKVTLYLSNGFVISRYVEKKKSGKNGYEVFNPYDGSSSFYNTKSLPLIQEYLGFNYLDIDEKKSVPLNFQKQGISWFFIGDNFTNTDRAKIIGAVYQTHYVDAVIKDLESNTKKYTTRIKEQKKEIEKLDREIEKFDYLPQLEKIIEKIETRLAAVQEKQELLNKAKALIQEQKEIEKQIKQNELLIQSLQHIPMIEKRLEEVTKKVEQHKRITRLKTELDMYVTEYKKEQKILQSLEKIEKAEDRLLHLEEKVQIYRDLSQKWKKAYQLEEHLNDTHKKIQDCLTIIEKYQHIQLAEQKISDLETKIQKVQQARIVAERLKEITTLGITERNQLTLIIKENQKFVSQYQSLLKQVGTCPVCQSAIDEETIHRISESYLI